MIHPDIPDFSRWATNRLEILLEEYDNAARTIKILEGGTNNAEYRLFQKWSKAIQAELDRRNA